MTAPSGNSIVVGAQWGDEGKGKIVDILNENADLTFRYGGGANSGHTMYLDGKKYVTHTLPVGTVRKDLWCMAGPYVVCDPDNICHEIKNANEIGSHVLIDEYAPVITPLHVQIDKLREQAAGAGKVGTTGKGIDPCYEDFVARRGVRIRDMLDAEAFERALHARGFYADRAAQALSLGATPKLLVDLELWRQRFSDTLSLHSGDTRMKLAHALDDRKRYKVVFEGHQGILLDLLLGWPYCTSSFCTPSAAYGSLGLRPDQVDDIIGIFKAYVTRVGNGPFPTKIPADNPLHASLREKGDEFGATTGRPRDCGYLDIPLLKFAIRMGGLDKLVMTKLDILSGHGPILVCEDYELDGRRLPRNTTLTADLLERVRPVYVEHDGWEGDLRECRTLAELPYAARRYVESVEALVGIPIIGVSIGPDREQMIWC